MTSGKGALENGAVDWTYNLAAPSSGTTLSVTDASGKVVYTGSGGTAQGNNDFAWNGQDSNGNQLPDGQYTLSVAASAGDGTAITSDDREQGDRHRGRHVGLDAAARARRDGDPAFGSLPGGRQRRRLEHADGQLHGRRVAGAVEPRGAAVGAGLRLLALRDAALGKRNSQSTARKRPSQEKSNGAKTPNAPQGTEHESLRCNDDRGQRPEREQPRHERLLLQHRQRQHRRLQDLAERVRDHARLRQWRRAGPGDGRDGELAGQHHPAGRGFRDLLADRPRDQRPGLLLRQHRRRRDRPGAVHPARAASRPTRAAT